MNETKSAIKHARCALKKNEGRLLREFEDAGDGCTKIVDGVYIRMEYEHYATELYPELDDNITNQEIFLGWAIADDNFAIHTGTWQEYQTVVEGLKKKENEAKKEWAKNHPSKGRNSLEATIDILGYVKPGVNLKKDGSDVLGDLNFTPSIDAMEFVCAWAMECGYDFAKPACDTFKAFMRTESKKTVKDLSEVIERLLNETEPPKGRRTFCDEGCDCPHFECHSAYRQDLEMCEEVDGDIKWENQQCYMCKHWDNSNGGEPCDCTIGECTYRWKDPNGEKQQTFWED